MSGGTHSGQDDVFDVAHAVCLVDALLHFYTGYGHHLQQRELGLLSSRMFKAGSHEDQVSH